MASIGGLNPGKSSDTISQKFNGADANTEIWGYCTMENNSSTNKVGRITVSTTFSGGNLNVAVGSSYGATDGASGTVKSGSSFSCYVSYLERSNYIVITVPQEIREDFTVSITFTALSGREATYEVENGLVYTGSTQYGITNLSNCSVISGTRSATNPGNYTCTLRATNSTTKYSDCYYFNNDGVAQSLKTVAWEIAKGIPDWTINPFTTNIDVDETGSVVISGTFTGIDSVEQSSSDGGQVSLIGLNGNQYSFKGTKAGTVIITINSKENTYYIADSRYFRVIVSAEKEEQHWYYSNASVEVGKTAYLSREGYNISSATPSITVGNSSIISATIDSDGQITVRGKAIGTSSLTITIGEDKNYKLKTDKIYISVIPVSKKNYIKVWNGSSWVNAIPYIYFDGSWHESVAYVNDNGEWKETTE